MSAGFLLNSNKAETCCGSAAEFNFVRNLLLTGLSFPHLKFLITQSSWKLNTIGSVNYFNFILHAVPKTCALTFNKQFLNNESHSRRLPVFKHLATQHAYSTRP